MDDPGENAIVNPEAASAAIGHDRATPEVGEEMPDGTIYAGISPDTGRPMYADATDSGETYTFKQALYHPTRTIIHGHRDFRVPSKAELNVLYENRNKGKLKGTFNESGGNSALYPQGWYWSSSPHFGDFALTQSFNAAWAQNFSDGEQDDLLTNVLLSLRCVRG